MARPGEILVLRTGREGEARQRGEEEFRSLLERAGLDLLRVIPTESEASVVEAAPA